MKGAYLFLVLILCSCFSSSPETELESFNMFSNYHLTSDTLVMEMDLSRGPFKGIALPSDSATDSRDYFHFNFTLDNKGEASRFFYKLYYRNISYMHSDKIGDEYNPKSAENFFGSWSGEEVPIYKLTDTIQKGSQVTISDSIKIMGNPFNLDRFFGPNPLTNIVSEEDIQNMKNSIVNTPEWFESIKEKIKITNHTLEDQIRYDAIWSLRNAPGKDSINLRYRDNPRVGLYEFMLVVGKETVAESIPEFAFDHTLVDPEFGVPSNPFYYFPEVEKKWDLTVIKSANYLRTFAIIRPDEGLYYDELDFKESNSTQGCRNDPNSFEKAHFIQFTNTPVLDSSLNNIDQKLDVAQEMTQDQFNNWSNTSDRNADSYVLVPEEPCRNAKYDSVANLIRVINPGNEEKPYRKENGGIEGRFGFTYGKFKAQISFPELLSEENVWNGVTCAFWLKFLSLDDWNLRDVCESGEGYVVKYLQKYNAERKPRDSYSEIDIEIVKAGEKWLPLSYGNYADTVDFDDPASNDDLIISCTNWDLGCKDPSQFGIGARAFEKGDDTYYVHRWGDWYKALTSKNPYPHDKTVGKPLWYEIDWKPTTITWRIGENQDGMKQICFMDSSITKIPNNVMNPVVSQEFHYGHWWPTSPFQQGNIPYPDNDIVGKVIEIRIE